MKNLLLISQLLMISYVVKAQTTDCNCYCDCPKPIDGKFFNICTLVENQDFSYKKEIMKMSCVDVAKDSKEIIKAKVNCMWNKYFTEFDCVGEAFITDGNVLKYAVNQGFVFFIDGMVNDFSIDINLKDPSDGKTLLDFCTDEINKYKGWLVDLKATPDHPTKKINMHLDSIRIKEYEAIYNHLQNDLYALHSNELARSPQYRKGVEISLSKQILEKYTGKFTLQLDTVVFNCNLYLENETLMFKVNNDSPKKLIFESPFRAFIDPTQYFNFSLNATTNKYEFTYSVFKAKRIE